MKQKIYIILKVFKRILKGTHFSSIYDYTQIRSKCNTLVVMSLRCFEWVTYIHLLNVEVAYLKFRNIYG